jgi:hypothetical protein
MCLQGDIASTAEYITAPGRSGASSNASLSSQQAPPQRRKHVTQPSFSEYVSAANTFSALDQSQKQNRHPVGDSQLASMPSFERLRHADAMVQHDVHPMLVGHIASTKSEPDTPTLGARDSQMPSTIVHEDVMSSNGTLNSVHSSTDLLGSNRSRLGGPMAESTGRDNRHSSDSLPLYSPFEQESSVPLIDHRPTTDAHAALAAAPGDRGLANTSFPRSSRPLSFIPPEPHEMQGETSTAGGGGSHMSFMNGPGVGGRRGKPPPLMIDNPNDAASTIASEHQGAGFRFDMSVMGGGLPTRGSGAVAAVANDRNVIDAEDGWNADLICAMQQVSFVLCPHVCTRAFET